MFEIFSFFFLYCQLATCEIHHLEKSDLEIYSVGEARRPAGWRKEVEESQGLYLRSSPASLEIISCISRFAVTFCFSVWWGNTALVTPGVCHVFEHFLFFKSLEKKQQKRLSSLKNMAKKTKSLKIEHIKCKFICYWVYLFYIHVSIGFFGYFIPLCPFPCLEIHPFHSNYSENHSITKSNQMFNNPCFVPWPQGSKFSSMKLFGLETLNCFFRPWLRPS